MKFSTPKKRFTKKVDSKSLAFDLGHPDSLYNSGVTVNCPHLPPGSLHQKGSLKSFCNPCWLETRAVCVGGEQGSAGQGPVLFTSHSCLFVFVCLCVVCTTGQLIHGNDLVKQRNRFLVGILYEICCKPPIACKVLPGNARGLSQEAG